MTSNPMPMISSSGPRRRAGSICEMAAPTTTEALHAATREHEGQVAHEEVREHRATSARSDARRRRAARRRSRSVEGSTSRREQRASRASPGQSAATATSEDDAERGAPRGAPDERMPRDRARDPVPVTGAMLAGRGVPAVVGSTDGRPCTITPPSNSTRCCSGATSRPSSSPAHYLARIERLNPRGRRVRDGDARGGARTGRARRAPRCRRPRPLWGLPLADKDLHPARRRARRGSAPARSPTSCRMPPTSSSRRSTPPVP